MARSGPVRIGACNAWRTGRSKPVGGSSSDYLAPIQSMFRDHDSKLSVGTRRGPAVLRNGRFAVPEGFGGELAGPLAAIGETRDGTMLFAVEHGNVYFYKGGNSSRTRPNPGPPRPGLRQAFQDINAIYTDPSGVVWMGSTAPDSPSGATEALPIPGARRFVRCRNLRLRAGDAGPLWMACSKGFFSVSRDELLQVSPRQGAQDRQSPYSPLDGLRTIQGTPGVQPVGCAPRRPPVVFGHRLAAGVRCRSRHSSRCRSARGDRKHDHRREGCGSGQR